MDPARRRATAARDDALVAPADAFGRVEPAEQVAILAALAAGAASGSARDLETLLHLIDDHSLARRAIRRILVNAQDVEDAHQDTLIAVARSVDSYRADAAFTTWLQAIARNRAIDVLRRRRETVRLDSEVGEIGGGGAGRRLSSMVASRADLRAAIEMLDEPYRTALVLRDVEQRSYREVAARSAVGVNTVKSRIHRARAMLAASLTDTQFVEITTDG